MEATTAQANELERRVDLSIAIADVEKEMEQRLKRMGKNMKMPGFRPGKVPAKVIEQRFGEQVRAEAADERRRMTDRLREYGLIGDAPTEQEIIEAMHCYIAETPAEMLAIALVDAVGDRKSQNMPGTDTEYVNWRVPLTDGSGDLVLIEDLAEHPRLLSLVEKFTTVLQETRQ
mgnify:CR=1 FL=1